MKQQVKILVIDDDVILLRRIDTLLTANGYDVITAKNGGDGIRMAFEKQPDIILCDILMPGVGGYNVFDILRKACVVYSTPFVFISAQNEMSEVRNGMLLGADDFIIKPFDDSDLLNTIAGRLQKNQRLKGLILEDLRRVLNFSTDGLFLSMHDELVEVNSSLCHLLGYEEEELKGKTIFDFLDSPEADDFRSWLEQVKKGISSEFKKFIRLKTKHGIVNGSFSAVPVKGYLIAKATVMGVFQSVSSSHKEMGALDHPGADYDHDIVEVELNLEERFNNTKPEIELSKREKEVLSLSCAGLTIKEVADKLYISDRTVEKYRSTLMEKFAAKNFIEVSLIAIKLNLIKI